ncbi:MAG: hypothetical protein ABIJ16_11880 [Bacteroidota bacterium]
MSYYRLFLFLFLCTMISIPGCRKGEEDPLISLRSRKNRLTGEWNMQFINGYIDYYNDDEEVLHSYQFVYNKAYYDCYRYSRITSQLAGCYTHFCNFGCTLAVNEDGTTNCSIHSEGYSNKSSGLWQWINDIEKRKSYIYMSDLNVIQRELIVETSAKYDCLDLVVDFDDFDRINSFKIIRLSEKELKLRIIADAYYTIYSKVYRAALSVNITFEKQDDKI